MLRFFSKIIFFHIQEVAVSNLFKPEKIGDVEKEQAL